MMIRLFCVVIGLSLILGATAGAVDGLECRLTLHQYDSTLGSNVLLLDDTTTLVKDVIATGFIGPISVEINVKSVDSVGTEFNVHAVTHSPSAKTYSRSYTVEYTLPARIRDIEGKNGARYSFAVTPLSAVDIDTTGCLINHREVKAFSSMPSAFMDLYYVPSSLADFYWESVRGYLDAHYRIFQKFAGLNLPGKVLVYLCPCPIYSVIWDKRFGMAVDPTRSIAFAMYTRNRVTADPFIVTHTALLRNYGYTAPFLSEGLANYFSLATPDMRRLLSENSDISLTGMLATSGYFAADPTLADRVSTTFVRFLVDQYRLDRFMEFYRAADDLNIGEKLELTYGKTVVELEAEWKQYVDTVTLTPQQYYAAASLTEQMLNYPLTLRLAEGLLEVAANPSDSVRALKLIRQGSFFTGDYYRAAGIQDVLLRVDSSIANEWMARGSYRMMTGDYDEALRDFEQAHHLDSTSNMVNFNLASNYLYRGDTSTAREILTANVMAGKGASAQGEIRITLANILSRTGDATDREVAQRLYREAINMYESTLQVYRSSASHYMWLGIAYLGMDDKPMAIDFLQVAEFVETRTFYAGMIQLWLGKAYIAMDRLEEARDHLANVLTIHSSDYHQRQARALLEQL